MAEPTLTPFEADAVAAMGALAEVWPSELAVRSSKNGLTVLKDGEEVQLFFFPVPARRKAPTSPAPLRLRIAQLGGGVPGGSHTHALRELADAFEDRGWRYSMDTITIVTMLAGAGEKGCSPAALARAASSRFLAQNRIGRSQLVEFFTDLARR
jgi:hypothetical protein